MSDIKLEDQETPVIGSVGESEGALAEGVASETIEDRAEYNRSMLKMIAEGVLLMKNLPMSEDVTADHTGEVYANIMLAYRHVEDARMRLGKVLQALNNGVSSFTQKNGETVTPEPRNAVDMQA